MFHQTRGDARLPEMDWDYYGVHTHPEEQSRKLKDEVVSHKSGKVEEKGISKRVTSTPFDEEQHPHDYRSGTVNLKSFVSKVLLRIKQKFELNYAL